MLDTLNNDRKSTRVLSVFAISPRILNVNPDFTTDFSSNPEMTWKILMLNTLNNDRKSTRELGVFAISPGILNVRRRGVTWKRLECCVSVYTLRRVFSRRRREDEDKVRKPLKLGPDDRSHRSGRGLTHT